MSDLSVLILEDEALARKRLKSLLTDYGVQSVAEAEDAVQAFAWLEKHHADVVLVDIGLPGVSGMSFVKKVNQKQDSPAVIFTTAYDAYAVEAFEAEAVDYLLKPIRLERLQKALDKVRPVKQLEVSFIPVHKKGQLVRIPLSDMRYMKAEDKYIVLITADNEEFLMDSTLVKQEEILKDQVIRIHRRYLVHKDSILFLQRPETGGEYLVCLQDILEPLPVSRRQLPVLRELLNTGK